MRLDELRIFRQVGKKTKKQNNVAYTSEEIFTLNSVISLSLFNINKTQDK